MGKKNIIRITENDLKNSIKNAIIEHIEELSKIDERISIYTYDLSNEEDREYILSISHKLWDIIVKSYDYVGGVHNSSFKI